MFQTFEAVFNDGKIELKEIPKGITHAKVLVTFLEEDEHDLFTNTSKLEILHKLRNTFNDIPEDHSLANELISDRRREAKFE